MPQPEENVILTPANVMPVMARTLARLVHEGAYAKTHRLDGPRKNRRAAVAGFRMLHATRLLRVLVEAGRVEDADKEIVETALAVAEEYYPAATYNLAALKYKSMSAMNAADKKKSKTA